MALGARLLRLSVGATVVVSLSLAACAKDPPLDTVPSVDLERFQGQWYEIAKLPRPTQADCHGTVATYKLTGDTSLELVHQCHLGNLTGPVRLSRAEGRVQDRSAAAKLSVDFGGGYFGDYWIIDLGEHYEYAVIGHPTRQYLWVLSRTPTLDANKLAGVLQRARDKGFDTARLEYTQQAP